eukprot:CAMPEP_0196573738 /NCGR_PEP_ID=MMETSP1081-20130531/3592_1 /TAXON_ID=36882 /ORGANISM="Pyramimonas amylifera, Strain CCMP720" /LENGTH=134 /DNA_ID=CAMNT_0041891559 /DNA_START=381 /DNA_END=785 /DNA_ORIENTATION=-
MKESDGGGLGSGEEKTNMGSVLNQSKGCETPSRRAGLQLAAMWALSLGAPEVVRADEGEGFSLATAGKWAVILLVADLITAAVLGKSAFNFLSGDKSGDGKSADWKEKFADQMMDKMKDKEDAVEKQDASDNSK